MKWLVQVSIVVVVVLSLITDHIASSYRFNNNFISNNINKVIGNNRGTDKLYYNNNNNNKYSNNNNNNDDKENEVDNSNNSNNDGEEKVIEKGIFKSIIEDEWDWDERMEIDLNAILHFRPFYGSQQCAENIKGVGYGTLPFQCNYNTSGYTYKATPVFGTTDVNVSTHSQSYCNDYMYSTLFSLDQGSSCQWSEPSNTGYQVFWADFDQVEIPPSSVVSLNMYGGCTKVDAYWFATNGTAVLDSSNSGETTTYFCQDGEPYEMVCYSLRGGEPPSCSSNALAASCTYDNPTKTYCT